MPEAFGALVVLVLFVASALLLVRSRRWSGVADERGLPLELVGAEVVYAERVFRSRGRRLVARVDRVYRVDGELRLVELKTRERDVVYMSDVIELSVQRVAVQEEAGEAVSLNGWVIVQHSGSGFRRPHRVRLLTEAEVSAMAGRYRDIVRGRVAAPSAAKSLSQCRRCPHLQRCSRRFGDR